GATSVLEFVQGPAGLVGAIIACSFAYFSALRVLRAVPGEDVEVMRSILEKMPSLLRRPVGHAINFIAPRLPAPVAPRQKDRQSG
ncbi:hypothetical protein ACC754_41155, partial [Rhizobium johnstonii]